MDYFKSNAQLLAERQVEQRAAQRQRLNMPSKAPAPAPKMEMRMGGMRLGEPPKQAPAPSRPAAQKPTFKESSYIRGQRMSLTPDENIGSHTPMPASRYSPEQDASLRGGRFPAAPISEPGISGNWARPKR